MLKRIENVAVILLITLLPFGNILRFDLNNSISVLGIDIVASMLFMCSLTRFFAVKQSTRKLLNKSITVAPFLVIALISAGIHIFDYPIQAFSTGLLYFFRLILYLNVGYIILQKPSAELRTILKYVFISLIAFACFGLIQYILFPDLRSLYYQGWDEHLYRIYGTLFDPNFSGALFVFGFILSCGFYLENKQRNSNQHNKPVHYAIFSGLCFTALMLTYSRSSYLMFGVSVILLSIFVRNAKFLFITSLFFIIGLILLPKSLPGEGVNLARTVSVNSRLVAYQQATEIFLKHPVFGVGFNMYRYAQHQAGFLKENGNAQSWLTNHSGAGVPNSYLFILATTGLIGFLAFLYMVGRSAYIMFRDAKKKNSVMIYSVLSIYGGLFIHALFENSLFYPYIIIYFVLISISVMKSSS